ncbi:hypothetical protein [Cohnella zeiphila]|nr:hypothetical protein [Cohnella zeiphila]
MAMSHTARIISFAATGGDISAPEQKRPIVNGDHNTARSFK